MDGLVSAAVVAKECGVQRPGTILDWARKGWIPSVPHGKQHRFNLSAVRAALEARASAPPPTAKVCTVCSRELPVEEFRPRKDRAGRDTRVPECNDCHKAYNRTLRERQAEAKGGVCRKREEIALEVEARKRARRERYERWLAEQEAKWSAKRKEIACAPELACGTCGETKPRQAFHSSLLDARKVMCKACCKKRDAARFQALKMDAQRYRRRLDNPIRLLRNRTDTRMRIALQHKGGETVAGTFRHLGYTVEDLRRRLESTFTSGMSWDNMPEWHIDHIRPVSSFAFTSVDDPGFRECYALSNLQALWARDNLSKGAKWQSAA